MASGRRRRWLWYAVGFLGVTALFVYVVYGGGQHEEPGEPVDTAVSGDVVEARTLRQREVSPGPEQILFGDLHVHTTFSADAFMVSLPLMGGEGAHPPADACDFARYCADLDFFALTDHAEALTPRHWAETRDSVRQCNAIAGDPDDPDLAVFTGFEWSQVGATPDTHYGHKNVIFRHQDDARLPIRAIGARGPAAAMTRTVIEPWLIPLIPLLEFSDRQRYLDLAQYVMENQEIDQCPDGVDVRDLPPDCRELTTTPRELFDKLDQWGHDALVIPHGTTWGFYTPPGYLWDKQIAEAQDDPERQRLVEVFSGHGNSEEYRDFRAIEIEDGEPVCPEPTEDFEPCCHRAGELIRARCDDPASPECEHRVEEARSAYVWAGVAGHLTVPGATVEEWGECGQCVDCFNPTFSYRSGGAVQYMLARGDFTDPQQPRHHTMGFIASSDNHRARPGTGYKELLRRRMTEAAGAVDEAWRVRVFGDPEERTTEARRLTQEWLLSQPPFRILHLERQSSFFLTGGLVAIHSEGRNHEAIWSALQARQVYGTSGDRILLWFDRTADDGETSPMGSVIETGRIPRFHVRAAGAFEQRPGCPDHVRSVLGDEELQRVCAGECYHPGDERRRITRIEVVRVRRQSSDDEPVGSLIDDPLLTLPCPAGEEVCDVSFEDPDYVEAARDALYYVRAIQEPTPAVNAGSLRCTEDGCEPCLGDYRTPFEDDCLSDNEERAWSSPIYFVFTPESLPDAGLGADGG